MSTPYKLQTTGWNSASQPQWDEIWGVSPWACEIRPNVVMVAAYASFSEGVDQC